jgi:hypothetical protein
MPDCLVESAKAKAWFMQRVRFRRRLWILCFFLSTGLALADGMVFPEVYYAKVEIPEQQALPGEGTNFAWVVPLPSTPE